MRKSIATMVVFAFMVPMLLASAQQASATKPILTISDTVSATADVSCVTVSIKVTKCSFVSHQEVAGDWNGRIVITGDWVLHGEDVSRVTVHGIATFEGTILGRSGTVTMNGVTIWWPTGEIDAGAIHSGTGELEGIRGHWEFPKGFSNPTAKWFIWVHFE